MTMPCHHIAAVITAYLKGELPPAGQNAVAEHLAACSRCREEAAILRIAYDEMAALPAFPLSRDLATIAETARRQVAPAPFRVFGIWVPAVAALALLVLCRWLPNGNFSSRQVAQQPHVEKTAVKHDTVKVPVEIAAGRVGETPADQPDKTSAVIASHRAGGMPAVRPGKAPVLVASRGGARHHHRPSPGETHPDALAIGEALWARHVEAMRQSITQLALDGDMRTCAVLPLVSGDAENLPAADTLTATLVYDLSANPRIAVNRLSPLAAHDRQAHDLQPNSTEISNLARTVNADFLIVGSVEKAKTGYLLSLYVLNRNDNTIVFNGNHPVLLPREMFPAPGRQDTPRQAAPSSPELIAEDGQARQKGFTGWAG